MELVYVYLFVGCMIILCILYYLIKYINIFPFREVRNFIYRNFYAPKESFQNEKPVAGGVVLNNVISETTCEALKKQLEQYLETREKHKGIRITNLDETITQMQEHYENFKCSQYEGEASG